MVEDSAQAGPTTMAPSAANTPATVPSEIKIRPEPSRETGSSKYYMKRNFTQPFTHSRFAAAYLLVEVAADQFVQYVSADELGATYCHVPTFKLDESAEPVAQLAQYLYENGLSITRFRELARENSVGFSFVDDTPGNISTEICFHVRADCTDKAADVPTVPLATLHSNFLTAPYFPDVVSFGITQLISERETVRR